MRVAIVASVALACAPRPATLPNPPAAGISIALYDRVGKGDAYSVIDDRRWIDVSGTTIDLDHVDPGAALASLVIEPLVGELSVRHCTRDRIPDATRSETSDHVARPLVVRDSFVPVVHCTIAGAPGRHLIRILYVSPRLAYRAEHDITMTTSQRAIVSTRFAIATPSWHERAQMTLYDGVPGGDHPPREVARGTIMLDGTTTLVAVPPREVAAELRRVFDGAVIAPEVSANDSMWGGESVQAIWVWLELARLQLPAGPLHVHLELPGEPVRDIDVPAAGRRQADTADAPLRLPLWVDETLRGMRQRFVDLGTSASTSERFLLSVANLGGTARDVWIEEHLRPAHHRRVERAWPSKPAFYVVGPGPGVLRNKVHVMPGKIERVGYTIAYDP